MSQARGESADRMRHKWLALCGCPVGRSGGIVIGILLAAGGALWLALRLGWIPAVYDSTAVLFWPLVLIFVGVWIVVKGLARGRAGNG